MASEGIVLNAPEGCLQDPYTESRRQPIRAYKTPSTFDKLRQFIELDRQVLRFFCLWDDRESTFGELRPVVSIQPHISQYCYVIFVEEPSVFNHLQSDMWKICH